MPAAVAERVIGITVEGKQQIGFRWRERGNLAPGQFAADTVVSTVSPGTDVSKYTKGEPTTQIGYADTAVVTDLRSRTSKLHVGDRVSMNYGHKTGGETDVAALKTWVKLPDSVNDKLGTLAVQFMPIALIGPLVAADQMNTGRGVKTLDGSLRGERVAVFGAGPIGLLEGIADIHLGAEHVIIVDNSPARLEKAAALGLTPINFNEEDPVEAIKKIYSEPYIRHGENYGNGADIIFQCAPDGRALNNALKSTRRQGTVVEMAYHQGEVRGVYLGEDFHLEGETVRSAQVGNIPIRQRGAGWTRRRLAESGLEIIEERGALMEQVLFTDEAEFASAPDVFADYAARNLNRILTVLRPGDLSKINAQPWVAAA